MPRAKLRISIPEQAWIHDVSAEYPETRFRIVAVLSSDESGIALLKIQTPNPIPIITNIEHRSDISNFDLLWKQDEETMLQIETKSPLLLAPVLKAGIPLQTPFEVIDGTAEWVITTSSERLSALGTRLAEAGIEFETKYVRDEPSDPADYLLTDRQREVLLTAAEQGYYDTPRRVTLTEVSNSLDISKATGSDVLHRTEGNVLSWFIEEHLRASDVIG
ncbi:helix-turn-helix domain-containing protein [Halopenitus sp. H-Gu1]|uniref:helix-turn-helix domain-containing protein n=1 Tax=Halopenitus sp. H-Gu1 TaxID=3242697 RepID=UPI00359D7145